MVNWRHPKLYIVSPTVGNSDEPGRQIYCAFSPSYVCKDFHLKDPVSIQVPKPSRREIVRIFDHRVITRVGVRCLAAPCRVFRSAEDAIQG